ncbi:MAG: Tab2 family RNA-binding protein, partial [Prochloraceae cyanobacterium]
AEAKGFEAAKEKANGVHFLAVQSSPESESFAGFWLLLAQKSLPKA